MLKLLVIFVGAILVTAKLGIIGWLLEEKTAPGFPEAVRALP